MRLDYLLIFLVYFDVFDIFLLGKVVVNGLVEVYVYDLCDWIYDCYCIVDDILCGGGVGMVMKFDFWGEVFDEIIGIELDLLVYVIFFSLLGVLFIQFVV